MNTVENAIKTIQSGGVIIITDDKKRENEGDLVFAAEFADSAKVNLCIRHASGVVCIAINSEIAQRLKLNPMEKENTDPFYTAFYSSLDADPKYGITTGISALDRAITLKLIADPNSKPADFRKPGHVFPLLAKKYGIFEREGHTESAVDMMKFANLTQAAVICELMHENGTMLRGDDLYNFAKNQQIPVISTADIKKYAVLKTEFMQKISETNLPTDFGIFNMAIYQNPINLTEHVVLTMPENSRKTGAKPFVRMHSECVTSEIFFSQKCDCKIQLTSAMQMLQERGNGAIIYLKNHEGRGIGLGNKVKAYALQEKGYTTITANQELNLAIDARDYTDAISILRHLKLDNFDLYTGNPDKISILKQHNLTIEQIIPKIKTNSKNHDYLVEKQEKLGHSIFIERDEK